MGAISKKYLLVLGLIALGSCFVACGSRLAKTLGEEPSVEGDFRGEFEILNGNLLRLEEINQATVLIFAAEYCILCSEETEAFVKYFAARGSLPKNARILTLLIGAEVEDALDWRERHGVTWEVGIERGDTIFQSLCPERRTPCVVTFQPQAAGRMKVRTGIVPLSVLEEETGPWLF